MALRDVYNSTGQVERIEEIPDPPARQLTPLEIVELFTAAELLAIEQATSLAIVATRAQLFAAIVPIALDDPRFTGAIGIMVTAGILTEERSVDILAGTKPH